ncbi:MAG: DUF58 domain-containing protein [Planctomycetota bacterium]
MDPDAVLRLKDLRLRAKIIVDGSSVSNGLHRSLRHGSSIEFSEYRPYQPGDDPRSLDWKRYARTDRYFVKKFEDETSRRCFLVVDQSHSMSYGSGEITKRDYAHTIAATLAYYLTTQRDQVGIMTFDESIADVIQPGHRHRGLHHILACLDRPASGKGTSVATPLHQIAALARKRGLVVCISDMLTPVDDLADGLAMLRSRGHEVLILRVLDPAETHWSLPADQLIRDIETGTRIQVDPDTIAQSYRTAFAEHADDLQSLCDDVGVVLRPLRTDGPLADSLVEFLKLYDQHQVGPLRRSTSGGRR